jgi:glycosyltransferase involved in cell wall biosynthesis
MVSAPGVRIVRVDSAVKVLEQMDVFVHPGLDDAMPVSIVEALMCGVPCIVSNVGASPELVQDGVEGLVIQPASAEQIIGAMERFAIMTAEELNGYRTRARARYERVCRPEVVGKQVAGIYREVMGAGVG